ncbi:MAG: hypothetical protein AAB605_01690 [Patescibacteria group bacterium]
MRIRLTGLSALTAFTALVPIFASAQTLLNTLALVSQFLNSLIYLFITLAIVVFFWGLIQYLWESGSEAKASGLQTMLWGIVAIFVMVSIWGIIRLLQSTFRVTSTEPVIPKTIQIDTRLIQ